MCYEKFKFERWKDFSMASAAAMERIELIEELDFEELIELLKFFLYHSDYEWEDWEESYSIPEMADRVFTRILEEHGSDPAAHVAKEDDGDKRVEYCMSYYRSDESYRGFTHVYKDDQYRCNDYYTASSGTYTEDEMRTIWYAFYDYAD